MVEIRDDTEVEKVLAALEALKDDSVEIDTQPIFYTLITKGDRNIDAEGLFGIWKRQPRTLEEIRKKN